MTKKNVCLVLILVILAGAYVFCFTDWFKTKTIRIYSSVPPIQTLDPRRRHAPIIFGLIGHFRLTEIKVVPLADFEKNPRTSPLWHLISSSNSIPVDKFGYGQHIHGMKPAVVGDEPQDLESNVTYRIFVTDGHIQGVHDFQLNKANH
jgi:hypothetical protein